MKTNANQKLYQILWCSLAVVIAAQFNMNLFILNFKVSVGILFFPLFLTLFGKFPVLETTILSSVGVLFSRMIVYWFRSEIFMISPFIPEMFFYLVFGSLFYLYCRSCQYKLQPFSAAWIFLFDYISNFVELLFRLKTGAFSFSSQISIVLVACARALIVWCFLVSIHHYKFSLLKQEHAQRYQRLLLLISKLNGEVIWMKKNTHLIENTMNKSYQLYYKLKERGMDDSLSASALDVAKDIHEVKKEYLLILRGLSETMDLNLKDDGMYLFDILQILKNSLVSSLPENKKINFSFSCEENLYITDHYFLMSVLRNLFNNSIESSLGPDIHLKFTEYESDETYHLEIEDDGPGILPEDLEQIFFPGFSTKINYDTGEINRGLGLNLVQDLVEQQWHGKITVTSKPRETIFFIDIPKEEWRNNFS